MSFALDVDALQAARTRASTIDVELEAEAFAAAAAIAAAREAAQAQASSTELEQQARSQTRFESLASKREAGRHREAEQAASRKRKQSDVPESEV